MKMIVVQGFQKISANPMPAPAYDAGHVEVGGCGGAAALEHLSGPESHEIDSFGGGGWCGDLLVKRNKDRDGSLWRIAERYVGVYLACEKCMNEVFFGVQCQVIGMCSG